MYSFDKLDGISFEQFLNGEIVTRVKEGGTTETRFGDNAHASECHNFGSTWGCRSHCPAFEKGNCKLDMGAVDQFKDFHDDWDEDQLMYHLELYKNKISESEKQEIIANYNDV